MRVAVTGGSGNVGSAVAKRLIDAGHQVLVLDKKAPRYEGAKFIYLDLRDRQILQPALDGCDAVVHLGELPNSGAGDSPQDVFARNTSTGSTVFQTCADLKIARVIYTSTCQVYGLWGNDKKQESVRINALPMDETQPLNPQNAYALSKVANEGYAKLMTLHHGLSVAAFRLPHVMQDRWMDRYLSWVQNNPKHYSEGHDGYWTFIHGADVADAYLLALEQPRPGFEAYHLFSPDIIGFVPLRQRIDELKITNFPVLPDDWPDTAAPVTCAKALDHFGWRATRSWSFITSPEYQSDK